MPKQTLSTTHAADTFATADTEPISDVATTITEEIPAEGVPTLMQGALQKTQVQTKDTQLSGISSAKSNQDAPGEVSVSSKQGVQSSVSDGVTTKTTTPTPAVEAAQKQKLFAALLHRGAHAKLSRGEAILRASTQKRVIGDRADRHWALLLVFFLIANIAFALWHVMVFRGIAAGDIFVASPANTNPKTTGVAGSTIDVPAEVKARLETFSKRNDKVIKVVDPSL